MNYDMNKKSKVLIKTTHLYLKMNKQYPKYLKICNVKRQMILSQY